MDSRALISGCKRKLTVAAAIGLLAACGGSAQVKDDRIARLPAEDRQALMDEEQQVRTAQSNLEASGIAVSEAQQFRAIVGDEIDAAKAQQQAAQKAAKLAGDRPEGKDESAALQRADVEAKHRAAAEAKGQYAESLLKLRQAQQELRRAELDLAQARLEREQYEALQARGLGEGMKEQDFVQAENEAREKYEQASLKVDQAEGQAEAARETWQEARKEHVAAAQRTGITDVPIGAPAPPESLPTPAAKEMPEGQKQQIEEMEQRQEQEKERIEKKQRKELEREQREMEREMQDSTLQEPPTGDVPDTQGQQDQDSTF